MPASGDRIHQRPFADRRTLTALIAGHAAILIALGCSIWFELPAAIATMLASGAFVVALVAAVCAGMTVARSRASRPFRERTWMSGREVGVLTFVALGSLAVACSKLIYPRSWPTSVDAALEVVDQQLDAEQKRELAYLAYDDLASVHDGLGASIRNHFGLSSGNSRLLHACDPEYPHPDTCSSIIVSRFWRKARAELPAAERLPLEALEAKMERVRLKSHKFDKQRLGDVVSFFNAAIRTQLAQDARFTIHTDPAHADDRVSTAWHAMDTISLREALEVVTTDTGFRVQKTPPDLILERR